MEKAMPPGVLRMYGKRVVNTTTTKEDTARATAGLNQPDFVERAFFDLDNPRILHRSTLPDGSAVAIMDQTGKYTDISLLVIAKGTEHSPEKTESIYDYSPATQKAYWQSVLGSMLSLREGISEEKRVIAVENCIATYSNESHRTSRSIGKPHAHILVLDEEHIEEDTTGTIPHLEDERRAAAVVLPSLMREVRNNLPADLMEGVEGPTLRTELPHGYTMTISSSLESLFEDPSSITEFMQAHHAAYKEAAHSGGVFDSIPDHLPQPSYRLYIEEADGKLSLSISPEFLSHAGVMEAAGVLLDRSEDNQQRTPTDKLRALQTKAADKLKTIYP